MLLRNMPEPSNSQARRIRDEVQTRLQVAAAQQAESSASRCLGAASEKHVEPAQNENEVSVHQQPPPRGWKTAPVQNHLIDNQRQWSMHDTTSTSIAAVDMGMQRRAATAPTAAKGTTATRTRWPQNHQALACLAEQSAARYCPVHFDPRPASLNTTAKPSQNCGWQTSG